MFNRSANEYASSYALLALSSEPWTIKLNLNEWVRFTRPGEYRLIVSSDRVEARDQSNQYYGGVLVNRFSVRRAQMRLFSSGVDVSRCAFDLIGRLIPETASNQN